MNTETYGPPALLHIFRDRQHGEGEGRAQLAQRSGDDFAVVTNNDGLGWTARVIRCSAGGTLLADRAWGNPWKRRKDAVVEVAASGIPFMPGFRA